MFRKWLQISSFYAQSIWVEDVIEALLIKEDSERGTKRPNTCIPGQVPRSTKIQEEEGKENWREAKIVGPTV